MPTSSKNARASGRTAPSRSKPLARKAHDLPPDLPPDDLLERVARVVSAIGAIGATGATGSIGRQGSAVASPARGVTKAPAQRGRSWNADEPGAGRERLLAEAVEALRRLLAPAPEESPTPFDSPDHLPDDAHAAPDKRPSPRGPSTAGNGAALDARLDRRRARAHVLAVRLVERAGDPGVAEVVFGLLAASNGQGPALAHRLMERWDLADQIVRGVCAKPGRALLEFVEIHFSGPSPRDDPRRETFRALLATALTVGQPDILAFLRHRAGGPWPVAWPTSRALHDGPLDLPLRGAIDGHAAGQSSRKVITSVSEALMGLGDPGWLTELADLGQSPNPEIAEIALLALARRPGGLGRNALKIAASAMRRPERRVRLAAAQALVAMRVNFLGRVFYELYAADPDILPDLVRLALLLPPAEAESFEHALNAQAEPDLPARLNAIRSALFSALARHEPQGLSTCVDMAAQSDHLTALDRNEIEGLRPLIPWPPAMLHSDPPGPRPARKDGPGKTAGLTGAQRPAIVKGASRSHAGDALRNELHEGVALSGIFQGTTFANCRFESCDFSHASFIRCSFTDCDLSLSDLKTVAFQDCVLTRCRFTDCALTSAAFRHVSLADVRFNRCALENAAFSGAILSGSLFEDGGLLQLVFSDCELESCGFEGCDLAGAEFLRVRARGARFAFCRLEAAGVINGSFLNTPIERCDLTGLTVRDMTTDSPVLAALRDEGLAARLLGEPWPSALSAVSPRKAQAMRAVLAAWVERREARRRAAVYLEDNRRRLAWAVERMTARQAEFLVAAPALVHLDVFERAMKLGPTPECRITTYHPDPAALALALRRLPEVLDIALPARTPDRPGRAEFTELMDAVEIDLSGAAAPPPPKKHARPVSPGLETIVIESICAIGSTGTTAMNSESDLDYWVCARLTDASPAAVQALRDKLARLEEWAASRYGLEVHFFLMDVQSVLDNNFGFSDQESSGSAQAKMLKEEFYRTAMRVAGRSPAWWVAPPGNDEQAHTRAIAALGIESGLFVDMGRVESIPPEEFFGAALWQIVKALKSPFKSIMKFALLEKYVDEADSGAGLLCERIKANLFAGRTEVQEIDPYALLFQEIAEYYEKVMDFDALDLVRFSYFLKVEMRERVYGLNAPERPEESSLRNLFASHGGAKALCYNKLCPAGRLTFQERGRLGAMVGRFIVKTYLRVCDTRAGSRSVSINAQDLTKLGRKISATLAKRPGKVERMPFLGAWAANFATIFFSVARTGRKAVWNAQGAEPGKDGGRLELTPIRAETALLDMVAWLTANSIWTRNTSARCDFSMNPVSSTDMQRLLRDLAEFFPAEETFDQPLSENLRDERGLKAFFILNLTEPRRSTRVLEAALIYSTNWGEMFCVTLPPGDGLLQAAPWSYLRKRFPKLFPERPRMACFVPDRAQCGPVFLG